MSNWSHSVLTAPPIAIGAPLGFTLCKSTELWQNDLCLHEGPSRSNAELRVNITTSWCPAEGTRVWLDSPPPEALTLDQARWLATALPEVLAQIGSAQ